MFDGLGTHHWVFKLHVQRSVLEDQCDTFLLSQWGLTPIYRAAWNGHLDVVQLLHTRGALLSVKDEVSILLVLVVASPTDEDVVLIQFMTCTVLMCVHVQLILYLLTDCSDISSYQN